VSDALWSWTTNVVSVIANVPNASKRDKAERHNPPRPDATSDATSSNFASRTATNTFSVSHGFQADTAADSEGDRGYPLTTATALADRTSVPTASGWDSPHCPSAATFAAVVFVGVGVDITDTVETANIAAFWAIARTVTGLVPFLFNALASSADTPSIRNQTPSIWTNTEANPGFTGHPNSRFAASLSNASLSSGEAFACAAAKKSKSDDRHEEASSYVAMTRCHLLRSTAAIVSFPCHLLNTLAKTVDIKASEVMDDFTSTSVTSSLRALHTA